MMYVLLLLAALWPLGQPPAAPPCQARLHLSQEGPLLTLTGQCQSLLDEPARYRYQPNTSAAPSHPSALAR